MPHELTESEVRTRFVDAVRNIARYWATIDGGGNLESRCDGVAFSILALLDGCNTMMPGWIVAPSPHPEDREYCQGEDEDWFPENHESTVKCDIGGGLHEMFYEKPRATAPAAP